MDPKTTTVATPSILPSRLETRNNSDKGSTDQRRPVRRDPEKRRLQNIQAQKTYRERVRKRLDHLETLAASIAECTGAVPAATSGAGPSGAPTPLSSPSNSTITEHQSSYHHMGQSLKDRSDESSIGFSDLTFSPSLTPASSSDVALWDPTISIDPSHLTFSPSLTPASASDVALWDPITSIKPSHLTFSPSFTPASSSDVALWDPATSIDPAHLIHNKDTASGSQYWLNYVDCGCLRPHVQVSSLVPKEYRDVKVLNVGPDLFSANPYLNTLRVERICLAKAIFSNCLHIGITEDMFCDDDTVSPFFRRSGKTADDPGYDSIVKSIQSIFKTLKQDVRPIREQITTMHGPFIDVLPFPTFRRNLIQSGDAVDEEELYDDLLNGLVCWGGAGVGRRDRDCSTGYVSTGTPWDGRSWQARTWFLQKYWALLGGEDGELVQQSEWWRNMRGDEAGPWSGL